MNLSKVISKSLAECPLSSTSLSRSRDDCLYAAACASCSAVVGGIGISRSRVASPSPGTGCGAFCSGEGSFGTAAAGGFGASTSSGTSERNSPFCVNNRRSVTVKLGSFFFSAIDVRSLFYLQQFSHFCGSQFLKRQIRNSGGIASNKNLFARNGELPTNVAYCHPRMLHAQKPGTRNLAHFFFANYDFAAGSNRLAVDPDKSCELAMHRAARPDPLHNFLSDVAAFIKV